MLNVLVTACQDVQEEQTIHLKCMENAYLQSTSNFVANENLGSIEPSALQKWQK